MSDDYDEDEDEDEDGKEFILSINDKGEAEIHKPEDFASIKIEEMNLIKGFIEENKESFIKYCKQLEKRGNE